MRGTETRDHPRHSPLRPHLRAHCMAPAVTDPGYAHLDGLANTFHLHGLMRIAFGALPPLMTLAVYALLLGRLRNVLRDKAHESHDAPHFNSPGSSEYIHAS